MTIIAGDKREALCREAESGSQRVCVQVHQQKTLADPTKSNRAFGEILIVIIIII